MDRFFLLNLFLAMFCVVPSRAAKHPDILFIMADDLGQGDLGCYHAESKIPTPNFDRLAMEGMRFTDAHTPSSVCTPTRYGVLTGRYCWRTRLKSGVLNGRSGRLIAEDRLTVASMARRHGYHTGVVGKWHLGLGDGLTKETDYSRPIAGGTRQAGFDYSYIIPASLDMEPYLWLENDLAVEAPTREIPASKRVWDGGEGFWRAGMAAPSFSFHEVLPTIASTSVAYLEKRAEKPDQPFFLYVPLASPHTPWVPNEGFRGRSEADVYGDFVHETDWAVGEILAAVDRLGLRENTLVIVTSDNGSHWPQPMIDETGHRANGPWRGQKADIHEGGHRVPFLVRWPGKVAAGSVSDQTICLTDFMATAAGVMGHELAPGDGEDSFDLGPVLLGTAKRPPRPHVVHHSLGGMFALRRGPWKLIPGQGSGGFTQVEVPEGAAEGQLYHLQKDPGETTNLWESEPEVAKAMRRELRRVIDRGFSRTGPAVDALSEKLRLDQYKRIHQELFRAILDGEAEAALEVIRHHLPSRDLARDGETLYMKAVAEAQLGRTEAALSSMVSAVDRGVPLPRFLGGSRTGLEPLRAHPAVRRLAEMKRHEPASGPMLGCVSGTGVKVWVRTLRPAPVVVEVCEDETFDTEVTRSETVQATEANDGTVEVTVDGLRPLTRYFYRVRIDSPPADYPHEVFTLQTSAPRDAPVAFRLAFGGGAGYVPENERMWSTIASMGPDVLLLLGDNVYSDAPESPAMQQYCYDRRQARPEYRALVARTPVYAIWDDHDFGVNDCSGGPAIEKPAWKRPVYEVFRNNWVNPGYGGGDAQPGCYFDFYLGDVHFIMLDGRYYRNGDPEAGEVSMLGPVQRRWLLETLEGSRGTFKVLCSPVPWVFSAKGDSKDTWNGFQEERALLFDHLSDAQIEGVVLMSADRHRSDLWRIDREGAYPLYEFNSSRLTNQHVHPTMANALFSYNAKQSFGLVDVDTKAEHPTMTYSVVTIDGEIVHSFTLDRRRLR